MEKNLLCPKTSALMWYLLVNLLTSPLTYGGEVAVLTRSLPVCILTVRVFQKGTVEVTNCPYRPFSWSPFANIIPEVSKAHSHSGFPDSPAFPGAAMAMWLAMSNGCEWKRCVQLSGCGLTRNVSIFLGDCNKDRRRGERTSHLRPCHGSHTCDHTRDLCCWLYGLHLKEIFLSSKFSAANSLWSEITIGDGLCSDFLY